jgi:hypothetical protein
MSLPSPGWVARRAEAPVTAVPLPLRAEYEYTDAWTNPARQVRARTVTLTAGDAGSEVFVGAGDAGGARLVMFVDDVYSVVLVDALLLQAPLEQGWAFTFDGHVFYVLNSTPGASLVYDITTGQWHGWVTAGEDVWNMHRGLVWKGRVLGADFFAPRIWELDSDASLDEGVLPIERVVSGFQPFRGQASVRQGSLRLTARRGDVDDAATISLRFSDDGGRTWSAYREVTLPSGERRSRVEFRSLGRMRAPGRLWELSDTGSLVRIDGVDTDVDGAE